MEIVDVAVVSSTACARRAETNFETRRRMGPKTNRPRLNRRVEQKRSVRRANQQRIQPSNYAKAWALYDSNRAYWENLYGDDPVTSPNHPASPPKSLLPRQPGSIDPGYNFLEPAPTYGAAGQFGTGGVFAPGPATSSRPLYEMQSLGSPPIGLTPPDATGDNKPVRHLGVRTADTPAATVFDSGAPAVPFVSSSAIPGSGQSATFNQRFPASDELEAFRRQWLKTFMEP
ncbi:MAG: hypothetical protein U1E61_21440 [Bradyrhizobium sp.]